MAKTSDIIHDIDNKLKVVLMLVAKNGGKINQLELSEMLEEYGMSYSLYWKTVDEGWTIHSVDDIELTNTGWALVEAESIIDQFEKLLMDDEPNVRWFVDFDDDNNPLLCYYHSCSEHSYALIDEVLADARKKITSNAKIKYIWGDYVESTWIIGFAN